MAPKIDYYEGPVCYEDGWHYTVIVDEADRERRIAIASANLKWAETTDVEALISAAQDELAEVQAHPHDTPGERLVCEDNEDGSAFRYRLATDADTRSWHDRKHQKFAEIIGEPTAEDIARLKELVERFEGGA